MNIANEGLLPGWLKTAGGADIVMVHLGTNDLWKNAGRTTEEIIKAYEDLVEDMRVDNPAMKIIVSFRLVFGLSLPPHTSHTHMRTYCPFLFPPLFLSHHPSLIP